MRTRLGLGLAAAMVVALLGAPAAFADSSQSANWAGYAAHRGGVRFEKVVGSWTQPRATCSPGMPSYSAVWVGLGGYARSSRALEQIGTELDCSAGGRAVSSAWYELVPAASRTTKLIVRPGDRVRASVAVSGRQVHLSLADLTRHRSFATTVRASALDVSSAEWIVEAPSTCTPGGFCQPLPLANFGATTIGSARAESTSGHTGSIADRHWEASEISLLTISHRFVAGGGLPGPSAVPSSLARGGGSFTVTYQDAAAGTPTASASRLIEGPLVHPLAHLH